MPADVLRLATWNVNSIRARVDRVVDWLQRGDVDVLAMQETKCSDDQFPAMPFVAAGYEVVHCGFNQWNGVAIASRVGLDDVQAGFEASRPGARTAPIPRRRPARWAPPARAFGCGAWYVPNGRTLDDPLPVQAGMACRAADTAETWLHDDPDAPVALVGDWNIAPADEDVWDMAAFDGATHVSEPGARRSTRSSTPGSPMVAPVHPGPGCTLGTTPSWRSRSAAECASTSSSAHRGWRDGWCTPRSSGRTPPRQEGRSVAQPPVLVDLRR